MADNLHARLKDRLLSETPAASWGNTDPWATFAAADADARKVDPAAPSLLSLDPAARKAAMSSHLARADALQAEASAKAERARTRTDDAVDVDVDGIDIDELLADEDIPLEQLMAEEGLLSEDVMPGELDGDTSAWWLS
jgi:hypothetical protein